MSIRESTRKMFPNLREKIFIFSSQFIYENISIKLKEDFSYIGYDKNLTHDFITWGIKKAFSNTTGFSVTDFKDNRVCQEIYNNYKREFEKFIFSIHREMGNYANQNSNRYNLVITYDNLYIITY